MTTFLIDEDRLEIASDVLRALAHDLRLRLLAFIDQNEKVNVNKIYNTLGLEQSITSQHLRILRLANLVKTQRDGKQIFYSVNYDNIEQLLSSVKTFLINS